MKSLKDSPLLNVLYQDLKNFTKIASAFVAIILLAIVAMGIVSYGIGLYEYEKETSVQVNVIDYSYSYSELSLELQTYNKGHFTAKNVMVQVSVTSGDNVVSSKNVFVGTIKPGNSKNNKVVFHLNKLPAEPDGYKIRVLRNA